MTTSTVHDADRTDATDSQAGGDRRSRFRPASVAVGPVAALAGLGAAELVAGLVRGLRSPVLDVGDRVVDLAPGWLKDVAIAVFGTNDKIALLVGIGVLLLLYSVVIGVVAAVGGSPVGGSSVGGSPVGRTVARRRGSDSGLTLGIVGIALFAVVGSAAALTGRGGTDSAASTGPAGALLPALPSVVGAVVAVVALVVLVRLARPDPEAATGSKVSSTVANVGRRRFVAGLVTIAAAGATLGAVGRRIEARFGAAESRAALRLPAAGATAPPVADGAQLAGAPPLFTPNDEFYRIDTALTVPQVPVEDWELTVTGLVDQPLRLSYDDLVDRGLVEADITLTCVSNTVGGDLIGTARWLGVRLDDLLAEAGVDPNADQVVGRSVDGYTCGFPVAALDGRDALIAIGMNGEPLPLEHGFPARLIVPGIYGYASATKWLTEIELTTFDAFDHYWVPRGYAAEAPIKAQSRIDAPRGLDRIDPGPFVVGGVAWAQPVGVAAVEVSIDEGPWTEAELGAEVNASTWRQWRLDWDATPGRHTLAVRTIDANGTIQTADRAEPLPDGATGHHTVVVLVNEA